MPQGAFRRMWHEHRFEPASPATRMLDVFDYTAPLGWLGRLADYLVLERYLRRLLEHRRHILKQLAKGEGWCAFLPQH